MEEITQGWYGGFVGFSKNIKVKLTEAVSGRINYSPEIIYQKGDLRTAFLADTDLFNKYKKRALANKENLNFARSKVLDWEKIIKNLGEKFGYDI